MSIIIGAIKWPLYIRKGRIVPIIVAVLFLLKPISAYIHGTLCIYGVFFAESIYFDGSVQSVDEEDALLVYQEGVDLAQVLSSSYLLIHGFEGSTNVPVIFEVGVHVCTLHGSWFWNFDQIPPPIPYVTNITCPGTDRVWVITSSDPEYRGLITTGNVSPADPRDTAGEYYNLFGKYCGSY
ncbi:hypothetical protein V1520DRAFT_57667 [Lipomyces starkeyi]|uniref:Uncharacterized protein n=1 Tax=Lipomyces starkeyi NRRL Y-11557 TaxID=675824 RepID=A0A1E3Q196_LIPST|nr:hypothetical protein LIPSTDRAFT_323022 [Lipomyces starkeyi NRRL Y-11557]